MSFKKIFLIVISFAAILFFFIYLKNATLELQSKAADKNTGETPAIGGDFSLKNLAGEIVKTEDFRGKLMLVYFGFASCPSVCPDDLANISALLNRLGKDAEKIVPIFITLDPESDTKEVLTEFMKNFDERIITLTGSVEDIKKVTSLYKVYYKKMDADIMPNGYTIDHSSFTYLMGKNGEYLTHFSRGDDVISMHMAVKKHLKNK